MALLHTNFFAPSLIRSVDVDVILPADPMFAFAPPAPQAFKTLYLLHGFMGAHTDGSINTNLSELAQLLNMTIVMPSGENSFYVDMLPQTMQYSKFIGEDLVNVTRRMFPLSDKREDTLIAGLSMGGYGALYNGLKHYKTFGHIIALSSALVYSEAKDATDEINPIGINRVYFEQIFGDLSKLDESDKNIEFLSSQAKANAEADNIPLDVYFACGWNDGLVFPNRKLHEHMKAIGLAHEYHEGPGTHDWTFWSEWLRAGLNRLYPIPPIPQSLMPFWIEKTDYAI
jgi:S-formylglutathione hydrolase FrmB